MRKLKICIVGGISTEFRGPQRFVMEFSKWLNHKSMKGVLVNGSLKKLVKSARLGKLPIMPEEERSIFVRRLPSIVRSLLYSLSAFLTVIHLNKRHHFSLIHAQDANYGAVAAIAASKLIHVPVILHIHGINTGVMSLLIHPKWLARLYRAYYLLLQKESVKRSDCVICVSEDDKKRLPTGKKIVIPMGANIVSFQGRWNSKNVRRELRIPNSAFTLGYVGSLSAQKGLQVMLRSFCHVLQEISTEASTYLLIVGEGSERRHIEDIAGKLGVRQYLRLTGFRTDVSRLLDAMDIFVFPSESEGSPIAILEAMAAGKAIIASDIPAIREIVKDSKEALLVDQCRVEELKRAILFLYNNSVLRAELGQRARERAKHYDVGRVYGRILKVYEELT